MTAGSTVNTSLLTIGPVAGPGGRVRGVRKSAIISPAEPRKLRVPAKIVTGRA